MSAPECLICGAPLAGNNMIEGPDRLARTPGRFTVRRCEVCGAGITLPLAAAEQLAALYPPDYAPHGRVDGRPAQRVREAVRGRRERREASTPPLADLLAAPAGRALDVGCGGGDLGAALLRAGWRVSGLDTSQAACERAAARGLDVSCATLGTSELPSAAFDAVVFQHSLEHVPDPPADLRRAVELLRPFGRVYVTLPNFASWQRRRFGARWFHLDLPRHRVHLVPGALERALRDAGLSDIRVGSLSSVTGLAGSIQYTLAGRCLFPAGLGLEASLALAARLHPLARRLDARAGAGDLLYATAARPAGAAG